ncbi:SH3 domain-containing protein Dlish [Leptopilina boulardi]|uniref:SH3 domain-containing protein Dlish n=1 Tax=Leptopilina boulardi TaxID=63433 RepID=UPI0021F699C4|nr:SH3 domain-containing protein Dlish [Leptopilina boulardi]
MAFLCPVRIRRGKKKKPGVHNFNLEKDGVGGLGMGTRVPLPPGRITGSASIETLVRVGIEKENGLSPDSKMVIIHDFTPCVDDELQVKRGQIVNVLYRENDWVYVIAADTRMEGFVPHSYCAPYTSQLAESTLATLMNNVKKKLPRLNDNEGDLSSTGRSQGLDAQQTDTGSASDCESYARNITTADINVNRSNVSQSQNSIQTTQSQPDVHPFFKDPSAGRYIVLYTFVARDENDVSVERGEFVTVLNRDDPDWFWVLRHCDGNEGFVPSGFVYPGHVLHSYAAITTATTTTSPGDSHVLGASNGNVSGSEQLQQKDLRDFRDETTGTELVVLYDYKAQAPDDLSVRRADWIYADLGNQTVDGWLWAYAPKTRKYGFIPKAYARPPAMTSL